MDAPRNGSVVWKTVSITLAITLAIFATAAAFRADADINRFVGRSEFAAYTQLISEGRNDLRAHLALIESRQIEMLQAVRELQTEQKKKP